MFSSIYLPSDLCALYQSQATDVISCLLIGQSLVPGHENGGMSKGARQSAVRPSLSNHLASRGPLKVTN